MIKVYTPADTLTLPGTIPGLLGEWRGGVEAIDVGNDDPQWCEAVALDESATPGEWFLSFLGCGTDTSLPCSQVRLLLERPEVRYRAACWLAEGQRCPNCGGRGVLSRDPEDETCPACDGTGYLRAPAPLWWALSPGPSTLPKWVATVCLHASVLRAHKGMEAVGGVLGRWQQWSEGQFARHEVAPRHRAMHEEASSLVLYYERGWVFPVNRRAISHTPTGHETGDAGKAAADAAALDAGHALLDGETLRVEVPGE